MKTFKIMTLLIILSSFIFLKTNGQKEVSGLIEGEIYYEGSTDINAIRTYFCNEGTAEDKLTEYLSIIAKPGEEKEICIIQFNLSSGDIYSRSAFPDSRTYSEGRFCSDDNSRTNPFSKFIKPFSEEKIKIPAKGYTIRRTTIKFPLGTSGMQYGCLAYGEAKIDEGGQMINFVIRRILNIKAFVSGEGKIESKISINKIGTEIQENKRINLNFSIDNNGSTDEIIDGEIKFYNSFGFEKRFPIKEEIIGFNNSKPINTKDMGQDFELPRYKGPFKIEIKLNHKPYFDFDISGAGLDPKILEGETIKETKTIFIFPTLPLIGLFVLIILLYFAFFRKPKVVYVQQNPNQQ